MKLHGAASAPNVKILMRGNTSVMTCCQYVCARVHELVRMHYECVSDVIVHQYVMALSLNKFSICITCQMLLFQHNYSKT